MFFEARECLGGSENVTKFYGLSSTWVKFQFGVNGHCRIDFFVKLSFALEMERMKQTSESLIREMQN